MSLFPDLSIDQARLLTSRQFDHLIRQSGFKLSSGGAGWPEARISFSSRNAVESLSIVNEYVGFDGPVPGWCFSANLYVTPADFKGGQSTVRARYGQMVTRFKALFGSRVFEQDTSHLSPITLHLVDSRPPLRSEEYDMALRLEIVLLLMVTTRALLSRDRLELRPDWHAWCVGSAVL